MSAPETLSDALSDGWDVYQPSEREREMYRELGPLASGVHVQSGRLEIGARVRSHLDGLIGTVESYDPSWGMWPWGIRWTNGTFELCSATELATDD
jgi:hypothetical protein